MGRMCALTLRGGERRGGKWGCLWGVLRADGSAVLSQGMIELLRHVLVNTKVYGIRCLRKDHRLRAATSWLRPFLRSDTRVRGQQDAEGRAPVRSRTDLDVAAVRTDERVDDGQAQARATASGAGPCPCFVGAVEAVEGPLGLAGRHSGALVLELEDHVTVPGADADTDRGAGRGVGDGVAGEVRGDLTEPGLVAEDRGRRGRRGSPGRGRAGRAARRRPGSARPRPPAGGVPPDSRTTHRNGAAPPLRPHGPGL